MAKRCIFCGKEYGLFGGGMVLCGDTDEPHFLPQNGRREPWPPVALCIRMSSRSF